MGDFEKTDIHLHVPAGGVSKDGPSAGVAITTALVSLLTGRRVRGDVAMTGEITLRGTVLPVGGIKEKVLAAHRAGIKRVVLPERNSKDIIDIPDTVRAELEILFVKKIDEALELTLEAVPVVVPGPDASAAVGDRSGLRPRSAAPRARFGAATRRLRSRELEPREVERHRRAVDRRGDPDGVEDLLLGQAALEDDLLVRCMHVPQPLMALTARQKSSKSVLLPAGFTSRFMRRRAGRSP